MYGVVGTDGVVYGPVPVAALYEWIAQGRIVSGTILIDWQGRQVPASMVPELQGAFPSQPAVPQAYGYPRPEPIGGNYLPGKRKSTALWLAFLLGFLGAHRFYLGHRHSAIAMLVLNVLAFTQDVSVAILLAIVTTIWLMVDMARIASGKLTGADGRPLS